MKTTPTAEEFLKNQLFLRSKDELKSAMIVFAKFHVQAALKAASKNVYMEKNMVLGSYPLSNIK